MSSSRLGTLLVSKGVVTNDQLRLAEEDKTKTKSRLVSSLVKLGHVNEGVLTTFLSQQYGITAISLDDVAVPAAATKLVPKNLCEKHAFVPIAIEGNVLSVAISDPTNVSAIDDIRFLCNMEVSVYLATETSIRRLVEKVYGAGGAGGTAAAASKNAASEGTTILNVSSEPNPDPAVTIPFEDVAFEDKTQIVEVAKSKDSHEVEAEIGNDKPVIRVLNRLFVEAVKRKCSDIHIEPYEQFVRVRFRVDGALQEVMRLPATMRAAVAARIKVMSELDISQKRLPQDGRIQLRLQNRKVDVRVSLLPTIFGEKVVMRLLDAGTTTPDIKTVGFEETQQKAFEKAAQQPYGMILVTGPTGSGKSTTLYAALNLVNGPDVNISTVEDPVEYNMAGVNQVQMKENIGMTFALALRSLLRQDPDVVMVGEIRDAETAEIAIKASLTGHMVFSTLHTNDAPSSISRLKNMGVEPFLITASLLLIEAQRLIRMNCPVCSVPDTRVTKELLLAAEMPENWLDTVAPKRGRGCDKCGNTGFKGRKGIFEVMPMTETLRTLIVKGANPDALKLAAIKEGLITLRHHGLIRLYRGETTLEEIQNNSRPDGDLK